MFIVEKLKLNKFVEVAVPKASDLFARLGSRVTPDNMYSEESDTVQGLNKVEQLGMTLLDVENQAAEAAKKSKETNSE